MNRHCGKCGGLMYLEVSVEDGKERVCHNCGCREPVESMDGVLPYVSPRNEVRHYKTRDGFHNISAFWGDRDPKTHRKFKRPPREHVASSNGDGQFEDGFEFQTGLDELEESMGII